MSPRPRTRANPGGLTDRQLEVLGLLADELTNAEIADRLVVSVRTVDHHVAAILSKLNVGSQTRLQRALAQVRSIAKKNGTNVSTMVASFLILHELTALVPLVLLFYIFGALGVGASVLNWLLGDAEQQSSQDPTSLGARFQAWARSKEERFER